MFYVLCSMFYHIYLCVYMNRFSIKNNNMRYFSIFSCTFFSALPNPLTVVCFHQQNKKMRNEIKIFDP